MITEKRKLFFCFLFFEHSGQNSLTAARQSTYSKHKPLQYAYRVPLRTETVMALLQRSAHLSLYRTRLIFLTGTCRAHHCPRRILAVATSTAQIPIRTDLPFSPC